MVAGVALPLKICLAKSCRFEEWSQKGTNFTSTGAVQERKSSGTLFLTLHQGIIAYTNPEAAQQSTTLFVAGSDKMLKEASASICIRLMP